MRPSEFHAHSVPDRPASAWEPLLDHLAETAAEARISAAKFGCGPLGELAGLLHDLGKYQPAFQARLAGAKEKVPHAAHGAALARLRYGRIGAILAHGIAGHHAGLADRLFEAEGRLADAARVLDAIMAAAAADGLDLPAALAAPALRRTEQPGFQLAFLARMLFSCLVDADYTATGAFYARAEEREPASRGGARTLAELQAALDRRLASFGPAAPGTLNAQRRHILDAVRAHADDPTGVFTLTVPTGGGKTLTSLAFALDHAVRHGLDRVVVAIPYTSVIEQTAAVYREALGDPDGQDVLEHHSAFAVTTAGKSAEEKWSGADKLRLAMESWDRPLVVATTVRLFESLFANRPAACRRLHNLARSVIVLDEVQTLPLPLLRPCVAALKELAANYGSSIVLCTATQPALLADPASGHAFRHGFSNATELAPDPPALFESLRRVRIRTRAYFSSAGWKTRSSLPSGSRSHSRFTRPAACMTLPATCRASIRRPAGASSPTWH